MTKESASDVVPAPAPEHFFQVRDTSSPDARMWSPARDITVVYPEIVRRTCYLLADPPVAALRVEADLGVTEKDLENGVELLARLIRDVRCRQKPDLDQLRVAMRQPVFAVIGMLFISLMSQQFTVWYPTSLGKGRPDPNAPTLDECLYALTRFQERSWLLKQVSRIHRWLARRC